MTAKPVGDDDFNLVREAILLPCLYSTIEHDIKIMTKSDMKMGNLYARHLRSIQNKVSESFTNNKKLMWNNGIKIIEDKRVEDRITISFMCRGYQQEMNILIKHLKADIDKRVGLYLNIDESDQLTDP
jgi:hypothetical protein